MNAWLEETKACHEVTEACLEKREFRIVSNQEEIRIKIRTGLEEIKATESEAVAEHHERAPHTEAMHLLTALQE
jgi:hypothetical protein